MAAIFRYLTFKISIFAIYMLCLSFPIPKVVTKVHIFHTTNTH